MFLCNNRLFSNKINPQNLCRLWQIVEPREVAQNIGCYTTEQKAQLLYILEQKFYFFRCKMVNLWFCFIPKYSFYAFACCRMVNLWMGQGGLRTDSGEGSFWLGHEYLLELICQEYLLELVCQEYLLELICPFSASVLTVFCLVSRAETYRLTGIRRLAAKSTTKFILRCICIPCEWIWLKIPH